MRSRGASGRLPVPCSASSSSCCCRACCKIRRVSRGPTYSSSSSWVPRPRRFSRVPARTASPARICSARGACFSWPPAPRAALNLGIFLKKVPGKFTRGDAEAVRSASARCAPRSPEATPKHSAPYRSEARSAIRAAPPAENSRVLGPDSPINSVPLTLSPPTFEDLGAQGDGSLGAAAGQGDQRRCRRGGA